MPNPIDPMSTNIAASGKSLALTGSLEFPLGDPTNATDRTPIVNLLSTMAYDQCIPFSIDVLAGESGKNLWEAPSETLRAAAVIVVCRYGSGGIVINGAGDPIPFPLATSDPTKPAWFMYSNPERTGLTVNVAAVPTPTGPGIQSITVDTENEARFEGYVFI